jgi:hypothetical protein
MRSRHAWFLIGTFAFSLAALAQEQAKPPAVPAVEKPAATATETARPGTPVTATDATGTRGDVVLDSNGGYSTLDGGVILKPKSGFPWILGLSGSSSGGFAVVNSARDKQLFRIQDNGDVELHGNDNALSIWATHAGNPLTIKESGSQGLSSGGFHVSIDGPGMMLLGGLQMGFGGTSMINGIVAGQPLNLNLWADRDVVIGGTSAHNSGLKVDSDGISYYRGRVGIGTTTPGSNYKLDVNGNANFTGTITGGNFQALYQDVAEWVPSVEDLTPGTVVVLDPEAGNGVMKSNHAYDTTVAGVVSAQPGIILGKGGASQEQIATTGRVRVRVDATAGAIRVGDLLVTSDKPGMAMKSEPIDVNGAKIHRPGTIVGKALQNLPAGEGEILVLLSLQ